MAKHIVIERPNGVVTIVRSELETPSETPLTEHEEIINWLYSKVKNLGLFSVSQQRELLLAYEKWRANKYDCCECGGSVPDIDEYIANNCG